MESGSPDDLGLSGVSMTGPFASAEEALAAARAAGLNLQQDPEGGGMYVHAESEGGEQQGGVQVLPLSAGVLAVYCIGQGRLAWLPSRVCSDH